MNELKPEDVMRALRCCAGDIILCQKCAYSKNGYHKCKEEAANDALALLREKDAELERLTRICDSYSLQYGSAVDKEVLLKKERADTVRKMQERIERHATNGYPRKARLDVIDQIAKEMVEES